jgi:nucleoside-diphosphate-sugar epimerase
MTDRILLTGISGFIAGHVALALLEKGFAVRGSVRNLGKADAVRSTLARHGADTSKLDFVALDLLDDRGWQEAAAGCRFMLHTASPFVIATPRDRNELIRPAVEGTERALRAALAAGVERVVLTSSVAAIAYGHGARETTFTAADWTVLGKPDVSAYTESKTRAERRAWEMMDAAGARNRLVTINPALVLGPLLDEDPGTSATVVQRLLKGSIPALPRISFGIVDVRDVAEAHVAAMTAPGVGGSRIPMSQATLFMAEMADTIRTAVPDAAGKVPRRTLPDWGMKLFALFDEGARGIVGDLGKRRLLDSTPATNLLGRPLRTAEEAISATAKSFVAMAGR